MKNIITSIIFTLLMVTTFGVKAQWEIPEKAKSQKSPSKPTEELALKGKKLFDQTCVACHGNPSKGNGILPTATDLGSDKYFEKTEGETFFQITNGMRAMPSFANQFTDKEKWNIIHFIRSFNPESTINMSSVKTINYKIDVQLDETNKTILATISSDSAVGVDGVKMEFLVKRYFGNLPITDAPIFTDSEGSATVTFPDDIPGDQIGDLEIIVKFENTDLHGTAEYRKVVAWGTHTEYKNILSERAMWGVGAKAPWWIMFLYIGTVTGVSLTILYVLFQIVMIRKIKNK